MPKPWLALFPVLTVIAGCAAEPLPSNTSDALEIVRKRRDLPALAVIVQHKGEIVERAAVGVRKHGDATPVTIHDRFHIGSNTKAMTATLAGVLVDRRKLRWETTVAEVFPELNEKMDPQYRAVTLEQLLRHRGGVPGKPPAEAWKRAWEGRGAPRDQRYELVAAVLAMRPEAAPGTQFIYSNQGYAIAGAMLERVADEPWEGLMEALLFAPLQMKSCGFGPPGAPGRVEEPWGHGSKAGKLDPRQLDNPAAIGPAGTVHCSLEDYARFVALHLDKPKAGLLDPATRALLQTPMAGEDYALGWISATKPWAGGRALTHAGSNTMWFFVTWLAPDRQFAVTVATNAATDDARKACDEIVAAMVGKHLSSLDD